MVISKSDAAFIKNVLLPWSGVKAVRLFFSDSKKKWPDIWCQRTRIPVITVTAEWARQGVHERRKRLVHEFLHIKGLQHNDKIGYNTVPSRDSYSKKIYNTIKNPGDEFWSKNAEDLFNMLTKVGGYDRKDMLDWLIKNVTAKNKKVQERHVEEAAANFYKKYEHS